MKKRLNKKESADINIYHINYVKNNKRLDPFCLNGFIEEDNGDKYLYIVLTDSDENVLIMHEEIWTGIKDKIKKICLKELTPAIGPAISNVEGGGGGGRVRPKV